MRCTVAPRLGRSTGRPRPDGLQPVIHNWQFRYAVRHAAPPGTASAAAPAAAGVIPVGAGPQEHYTVRQQPPAGSCHYRYEHGEPMEDRSCNPGAISPAVTQAHTGTTICRKGGYTGGIRPPASVTGKEKAADRARPIGAPLP